MKINLPDVFALYRSKVRIHLINFVKLIKTKRKDLKKYILHGGNLQANVVLSVYQL